jgi:hypothetical protein
MTEWLDQALCLLAAGGILLAGLLAFLRRGRRAAARTPRPVRPAGTGLAALARLLAAAPGSPYSRDRVQERLQLLADDLHALEGTLPPPPLRHVPETDPVLAAYFAEDHAGLRGRAHRTPAQDPDFPARTEAVLERLERRRHQGDAP